MGPRFIKVGIVYLIFGNLLGMVLHHLHDPEFGNLSKYFPSEHSLIPMHTHLVLLGGFLSIITGLIYQAFPRAGKSLLAKIHFWLANISLVTILSRVVASTLETKQFVGFLEPVQGGINTLGGLGYVISFVLFLINVFINVHNDESKLLHGEKKP